jgi:hypothetical protein
MPAPKSAAPRRQTAAPQSEANSFPIIGYDDLSARQVSSRLVGLRPAELRKVREYERRHANRTSVLDALEKALA